MDYQELVTAYNKKGLDITNLKEKLAMAKPLKGRLKYRALDIIDQRSALKNDMNNLLITSEISERLDAFESDTEKILLQYFLILVQSIKTAKAWKFMKLVPSEYTEEGFEKLNTAEKFNVIFDLNQKYLNFLDYQKVADIRDCLKNAGTLNEEIIRKLQFLILMFNKLNNKEVKMEFFCFDKNFLLALIEYRKVKSLKLEDFIKNKRKNVQAEYDKFLNFFTNEDFRNISENLSIASKTLKTSVNNVIEAFAEMSESEAEIYYLQEENDVFKKIEKKVRRMLLIRIEYNKELAKKERINNAKKLAEEIKQKQIEEIKKKLEQQTNSQLKANMEIVASASNLFKPKEKSTKEQVNPLIFSWLEREDLTLTRRMGTKKVVEFFEKIKNIQRRTGVRVALYIVTNAGKELALKRLQDFQRKAAINGLPNLVDGVLGGYSSFRIDKNGKITDVAIMSDVNKKKIIGLLENTKGSVLEEEMIQGKEEPYLRYQISERKDKSITKNYLNLLVSNLLKDDRVRRQPLKFLPYIEGKYAGIDVLLESQLKGISQLPEYYKLKYSIAPGKTMNARIDNIDSFINEIK